MTTTSLTQPAHQVSRTLNISLWLAQGFIFLSFVIFGAMKMFMPIHQLSAMWVWPGQVPPAFLRLMGVIDAAGGVGIFLPAVTRIYPRLTTLAALGCTTLQIVAIIFHVSRGEAMVTPINFVLLAICVFILWGRTRRARITAAG